MYLVMECIAIPTLYQAISTTGFNTQRSKLLKELPKLPWDVHVNKCDIYNTLQKMLTYS